MVACFLPREPLDGLHYPGGYNPGATITPAACFSWRGMVCLLEHSYRVSPRKEAKGSSGNGIVWLNIFTIMEGVCSLIVKSTAYEPHCSA
jgi:hypothetical protein